MRRPVRHTITLQPANVGELREALQILDSNGAPDDATVYLEVTRGDRPGEIDDHKLRVSW